MARENTTRYIVLGLLSHENMSGYDMKKRVDISIRHFWPVGYGQIYPTLKALEREGLIEQAGSDQSKGPPKNLYAITKAGRESLKQWLALQEQKEYTRYEILLKLFFGAQADKCDNIARIKRFKQRHEKNLKMMKLFKQELSGLLEEEEDHLYYYLTVSFGEAVYAAYTGWAQQALDLLSAKQAGREDGSYETAED